MLAQGNNTVAKKKIPTIFDSVEPLTEEEKRKRKRKRKKSLSEFVLDELFVSALKDDDIAEAVCLLAGILSHHSQHLRKLLKEEMKPAARWRKADLIMTWIDYAYFLEQEGGDKMKARKRLIHKEEKRIGKKISDGTMNNLLSRAINTIPLDNFPEHIHPIIKERLDRGEKTMHRGGQ